MVSLPWAGMSTEVFPDVSTLPLTLFLVLLCKIHRASHSATQRTTYEITFRGIGQTMWQVLAGRVVSGFGQAGMMVLAAVVITGNFQRIHAYMIGSYEEFN